ncbi:MAG TPA: hypothetical protein VKB25_15625 [Conexibacter sp.]|nr:hypothetical protein [Conexibacter sp.]
MPLGKLACDPCEGSIEADHVQLLAQRIDASDCASKRPCIDPSAAMRGCRCGARFGINELA